MKDFNINFSDVLNAPSTLALGFKSTGLIATVSEALARILNIEIELLQAKSIFDIVFEGDLAQLQEKLKTLNAENPCATLILRLDAQSKKRVCFHCTLISKGESTLMLLSDISALKNSEEMLLKKTQELESLNKSLDEFVHVASHDLRAPLRGIQLLSTWIDEDMTKRDFAEVAKHLELLKGRARRMDNLLTGLLEYSLIGRQSTDYREVDCAEMLTQIAKQVETGNKHLSLNFSGSFPKIKTCAHSLEVVFKSIIENSVRHVPQENIVLSLSVDRQGNFLKFSLTDNGQGIPEEYKDKVFEAFKTLRPRDVVESTGLGLSIVKKVVERIGGTVNLDTTNKVGAKIDFTWPVDWQVDGATQSS